MTLESQQKENREKFSNMYPIAYKLLMASDAEPKDGVLITDFLDERTTSTWLAATKAERERVRALVEKVRAGKDSHVEPDEVDITLDELIKEL